MMHSWLASVASYTASRITACPYPSRDTVHKVIETLLVQSVPFFDSSSPKVIQSLGRIPTLLHCSFQLVPDLFNWIHVWRHCKPFHTINLCLVNEGVYKPGMVCTRIVILKNKIVSKFLPVWYNNGLEDTVQMSKFPHWQKAASCVHT